MLVSETSNPLTAEPTSAAPQNLYDSRLGPDVSGAGQVVINTEGRSVVIFFSPSPSGLARVLYNTNFRKPEIPLKPGQELRIEGASNVTLEYRVETGGDFKLAWKILDRA